MPVFPSFDAPSARDAYWTCRHPDVLDERKKDLFVAIEDATGTSAQNTSTHGRKEIVAGGDTGDVSSSSRSGRASDGDEGSVSADRTATYEACGRATDAGRQQDAEERNSDSCVNRFTENDEEEHRAASPSHRRNNKRDKGKEKVYDDDEENGQSATLSIETECDGESETAEATEEKGEAEEVTENQLVPTVKARRKEKRRVRSFLNSEDEASREEFFFCDYPFLLDPTAKARIVHIDAAMQMSYEVEVL